MYLNTEHSSAIADSQSCKSTVGGRLLADVATSDRTAATQMRPHRSAANRAALLA